MRDHPVRTPIGSPPIASRMRANNHDSLSLSLSVSRLLFVSRLSEVERAAAPLILCGVRNAEGRARRQHPPRPVVLGRDDVDRLAVERGAIRQRLRADQITPWVAVGRHAPICMIVAVAVLCRSEGTGVGS